MTLLVMLLAALLDRIVALPHSWLSTAAHWWLRLSARWLLKTPRLQALLVLLVPLLLLVALVSLLSALHPFWGGLGSLLVLWLCLDFGALGREVHDRLTVLAGGISEAGGPVLLGQLPAKTLDAVVGVGVWFLLAGPGGVLIFRLLAIYSEELGDQQIGAIAHRLYGLMAWIPAQVMLMGYAIVGRFDETRDAWRHYPVEGFGISTGLLRAVASAAQGIASDQPDTVENLQGAWRLIWRQTVFLITIAAVLTLAGVLR